MLSECQTHNPLSRRPVDDGQCRQELGAGNRREPHARTRRLLRLVRRQGRPRRRRTVRYRAAGRRRHQRRRRATRAETGRRGLQPDVDRRRRAGEDPVCGRQRRGDRLLHHRPQPGRGSRPDRRGVPGRRLDDVRIGHQPGLRQPAVHPSSPRASATASTGSPSTRRPTPRSTTHRPPRSRLASASRSTTPTCRR